MADTVTIDAPLGATGANVYKGDRVRAFTDRGEIPAGTPASSPAISAGKLPVVLERGEEATVVFTAALGVTFVAARRVCAGRPILALDAVTPNTFARNTGIVSLVLTGGVFLPSASCQVLIDGVPRTISVYANDRLVVPVDTANYGVGTKVVKVRRAGLDSNPVNLTVT